MMIDNATSLRQYKDTWQKHFSSSQTADWVTGLRQQQWDAFELEGFPTKRAENWKYTNLASLLKYQFQLSSEGAEKTRHQYVPPTLISDTNHTIVFIDGIFVESLSSLPTEAVIITNLETALQTHTELLKDNIIQQHHSSFSYLNGAFLKDGTFIYVPPNCVVDKPVHLLFLSSSDAINSLHNIRNIVLISKGAHLKIIEDHQSLNSKPYFTNIVNQYVLDENAICEFTKIQNQHGNSFHIAATDIMQKRDSQFLAHNFHTGSQLARDDMHCYLKEQGAFINLRGLYLPFSKQHIDMQTYIHHLAEHTESNESFKGVIGSQSRAVFNGKIVVAKNIKQAKANLQNKNLLISSDAEVNTKPELEIYSDDVKCQHGATIGQIDQQMLFYLRSRGIAKDKAYQLLLLAFVKEHLETISGQCAAERIVAIITQKCEEVIL